MLLRLYIKNYAIIDELEIPFSDNLNVITGETGAGKSILLGALSLILGQRADMDMLSDARHKAVIEGIFRLPDTEEISGFFEQNELDRENETIIRREINPAGKSRAFINDTPVSLRQLSLLSNLLVDLHQQFDTLQLTHSDFQLNVLDALAENKPLLKQYREIFDRYSNLQKELDALREQNDRDARESDYNQYLFDELDAAGFSGNELEILEEEQQTHTHAEELKQGLSEAIQMMEGNDDAVIALLRRTQNILENLSAFHKDIPEMIQRIRSSAIELQDIAAGLQHMDDHASFDEERIGFIGDRLDLGYKLLKKHGVQTTGDLLAIRDDLQKKLDQVQHAGEAIAAMEKERDGLLKKAKETAARLSAARKAQLGPFIKKVNALLAAVGMPNAVIRVEINTGALHRNGRDEVTFLFDANKSGRFQPLGKVASGGELSRLMLCIKSLVARSVALPTLIFDEIDNGISGEAAKQAGAIMQRLASSHQVICITHQPQIAGKAHTHFQVYKAEKNKRVTTGIRILSPEERIQTIARMLSGENPGKAALANARELMK